MKIDCIIVSSEWLERNGAPLDAREVLRSSGREWILLKEAITWIKENKKPGWAAWLLSKPEFCDALIEFGINLEVANDLGRNALMLASWNGYFDVFKSLLDAGADRKVRDLIGCTAEELAHQRNQHKLFKLFNKTFRYLSD